MDPKRPNNLVNSLKYFSVYVKRYLYYSNDLPWGYTWSHFGLFLSLRSPYLSRQCWLLILEENNFVWVIVSGCKHMGKFHQQLLTLCTCPWNFGVNFNNLWWFSPTFYAKLLHAPIPKRKKIQSSCQYFLCFWGLCFALNVGEIEPYFCKVWMCQGQYSQKFLRQICKIFVTLNLKILTKRSF